jgi:hypothetical protein
MSSTSIDPELDRLPAADRTPVAASRAPATATADAGLPAVLLAILAALLACAIGLRHARPAPADGFAPATEFSLARAQEQLAHIAHEPHPQGSAANAQVRTHLVSQLQSLGLAPQVQTAFAVPRQPDTIDVGLVHNVLARLPGSVPGGKALMLAAHYDSVPNGDGAADDGASVAAILETLRALRAGPPLRNDLVVLLTDGEESGLLGAEAFTADHPWARDIGVVLNFEYRGNRGPMTMFETSNGNAALIDGLATASRPIGASWQYEVYKLLPNDTDLSAFKRAGMAGMGFAAIEGATAYHSELDTPERLAPATLQHEGELMLSLARHFGNASLDRLPAGDSVYSDVAGLGLVHYPAAWAMPIAWSTAALFGALLWQARRAGRVRGSRIFACVPFLVLVVVVASVAGQFLWMGVNLVHPGYRLMPDTYNSHWYLLAFVAFFTGLYVLVLRGLATWFNAAEVGYAAAGAWTAMLLLASARAPGASAVFAWPLLPLLVADGWLQSRRGLAAPARWRLAVRVLAASPALVIFAPLLQTLYVALSPRMMMATVFAAMLLLCLLTPLLAALTRRLALPLLPFAATLAFLAAGAATAGFDTEHRRANSLAYVQLPGTDRAMWLSTDRLLDGWTRGFFPADAQRRVVGELHGVRARLSWTGPAPSHHYPAPAIQVTGDTVAGDRRTVLLHVASPRNAPQLRIYVEGAKVLASSIQGRVFTDAPRSDWAVTVHGAGSEGVDLALQFKPGEPFAVRVLDATFGVPLDEFKPRAPDMMVQPATEGDTTQVASRIEMK